MSVFRPYALAGSAMHSVHWEPSLCTVCIGGTRNFLNSKLHVRVKANSVDGICLGEEVFAGFFLPWELVCLS